MQPTQQRLQRYLNSNWPGHQRIERAEITSWLSRAAADAFGPLAPDIAPVVLKSRKREWRALVLGDGKHYIVADLAYSELLGVLELGLARPSLALDLSEALAVALVGWGFLWAADNEKAAVLLAMAHQRRPLLAEFARQARQRSGHTATTVFVLLHEIAHDLVDRRHPAVEPAIRVARAKLAAQISAQRSMREDVLRGEARAGTMLRGDLPESEEGRRHLAAQIEDFEQRVQTDDQVGREIYCDAVALFALVGWRLGHDVFAGDLPDQIALSVKELGDLLMLGVQTLRLMQAVASVKSEAEHVRDDCPVGGMTDDLVLQTIRKGVMSNLAIDLFDELASRCSSPSVDASAPATIALTSQAFLVSLQRMDDRSITNLITPTSNVFEFVRSPNMFELAREEILARIKPELRQDLPGLAVQLHSNLPF